MNEYWNKLWRKTDHFCYTRLKVLTLVSTGVASANLVEAGIVGAIAGADLIIEQATRKFPDVPLIIDCTGVSTCAQRGLASLATALKGRTLKHPVIFTNVLNRSQDTVTFDEPLKKEADSQQPELKKGEGLAAALLEVKNSIGGGTNIPGEKSEIVFIANAPNNPKDYANDLIKKVRKHEAEQLRKLIADCFTEHEKDEHGDNLQRLTSTPSILTNGKFNARYIISDPEKFAWLVVHFAEKLDEMIDRMMGASGDCEAVSPRPPKSALPPVPNPKLKGKPSLLGGSLRASPFVAAIAYLSKHGPLNFEIVDHFGPSTAILEEPRFDGFQHDIDYIYVGDFMMGGSEVKVANHWCRIHKCRLKGVVVLGCLLREEKYEEALKKGNSGNAAAPIVRALSRLTDVHAVRETALYRVFREPISQV